MAQNTLSDQPREWSEEPIAGPHLRSAWCAAADAVHTTSDFLSLRPQETEHALEDLKQTFRGAQRAMDSKTEALRGNIGDLVGSIAAEEAKAEQLRRRVAASSGEVLARQEELLAALHAKVREVYEKCDFDAASNLSLIHI